ncbi:MAG: hypothetical protein H6855_00890 [Rhodospirillales bacterium]|nr:hypothetical protein [Rhodospirillales bacterium]MCB9964625.1 hypothetical protein [Rhodospirillales bacterium]MCB9979915.1 hypothetical protein [Rhodospirillales bacterium]
MKVTLKELMAHLGVTRTLAGYESDTSQFYDEEKGITCSAETRMGGDRNDLEVEVQRLYDQPEDDKPPVEQIMMMRIAPKMGESWSPYSLVVKGEDMTGKFTGWEEGACAFYIAVVLCLKRGEMPDIDALIDEHLQGEGGQAGKSRRGGGRKNPKFKPPTNVMNMKQGM